MAQKIALLLLFSVVISQAQYHEDIEIIKPVQDNQYIRKQQVTQKDNKPVTSSYEQLKNSYKSLFDELDKNKAKKEEAIIVIEYPKSGSVKQDAYNTTDSYNNDNKSVDNSYSTSMNTTSTYSAPSTGQSADYNSTQTAPAYNSTDSYSQSGSNQNNTTVSTDTYQNNTSNYEHSQSNYMNSTKTDNYTEQTPVDSSVLYNNTQSYDVPSQDYNKTETSHLDYNHNNITKPAEYSAEKIVTNSTSSYATLNSTTYDAPEKDYKQIEEPKYDSNYNNSSSYTPSKTNEAEKNYVAITEAIIDVKIIPEYKKGNDSYTQPSSSDYNNTTMSSNYTKPDTQGTYSDNQNYPKLDTTAQVSYHNETKVDDYQMKDNKIDTDSYASNSTQTVIYPQPMNEDYKNTTTSAQANTYNSTNTSTNQDQYVEKNSSVVDKDNYGKIPTKDDSYPEIEVKPVEYVQPQQNYTQTVQNKTDTYNDTKPVYSNTQPAVDYNQTMNAYNDTKVDEYVKTPQNSYTDTQLNYISQQQTNYTSQPETTVNKPVVQDNAYQQTAYNSTVEPAKYDNDSKNQAYINVNSINQVNSIKQVISQGGSDYKENQDQYEKKNSYTQPVETNKVAGNSSYSSQNMTEYNQPIKKDTYVQIQPSAAANHNNYDRSEKKDSYQEKKENYPNISKKDNYVLNNTGISYNTDKESKKQDYPTQSYQNASYVPKKADNYKTTTYEAPKETKSYPTKKDNLRKSQVILSKVY